MPPAARFVRVLVLLVAVLVLPACAGVQQASSPESGAFSGPDVAFLRDLVRHHEGTVALAGLADERAEATRLADAARDQGTAHAARDEQLRALLGRAGSSTPAPGGRLIAPTDGAVDQPALDDLEREGEGFDATLLDILTGHHRAGLALAERALDAGEHPEVRALAEQVAAEQQAALARLERLREDGVVDA